MKYRFRRKRGINRRIRQHIAIIIINYNGLVLEYYAPMMLLPHTMGKAYWAEAGKRKPRIRSKQLAVLYTVSGGI